jgi:predicted AlkP superfamily phosphohydrolase/phosphomutase
MLLDAIGRMRRGLTVCVFDAPDRIQHMFYRHEDADHPANAGRDCHEHAKVIDEMYGRMDQLVGRVAAALPADATLVVMSDHGFCSFKRGVNLNAWLLREGYLSVLPQTKPGDYFAEVDWSATRAYAFGLSGIYLNLRGREGKGIVPPDQSAALVREIAARLEAWNDPGDGARIVRRAHVASEAYRGPYAGNGPDIIVGYERGYRASWDGAVGRTAGPEVHDNTRFWSGDHCVDPDLVPGVFFVNRQLDCDGLSMLDVGPTILRTFGVSVPAYMDGKARTLTKASTSQRQPFSDGKPAHPTVPQEVAR